jgi:enoyl-[acyl-carrier protein] reductase/trans-2-enoyl-CoA reductase (NAD+)
MIVKPKTRGFICTTAHPVGCMESVARQVEYVKKSGEISGAKNVLIIGASTGYGLSSRIVSAFSCGAKTLGIFYEKPSRNNKTATAGWYNSAAFEKMAKEQGLYAKSINGDAFSNEIKEAAIETIKADMGKIDLVIYSLAAPKRKDPNSDTIYSSVIKPIGEVYKNRTIDIMSGEITEAVIEPATEEEAENTVKVMGGEDWQLWIDALFEAGVLAENVKTVAYSYIGPKVTFPIYREGTIGKAKEDLEKTAGKITKTLADIGGKGYVAVCKALVTQASSAIPVVPLYISALFKVMKEKGIHEGCIEQMYRLFNERLYTENMLTDEVGRIRIDDWEMEADVQEKTNALFENVQGTEVKTKLDMEGYKEDFLKLFGFNFENINYDEEVEIDIQVPSIQEM